MNRKAITKGLVLGALAGVLALSSAAKSEAALTLRLDDPTTMGVDVQVTDGGVGDLNPVVGVVTWLGSVGAFTVNVTTGQELSTPGSPDLDLNSIDSSGGAGTLDLYLSQDGFNATSSPLGATMLFGGTLVGSGTVTYRAYAEDANTLFGTTQSIGTLGPYGPGAFAGSTSGSFTATGTYSLTQRVTIAVNGPAQYSGDAHLVVPEPASLALFGLGLLGVGVASRRRLAAGRV